MALDLVVGASGFIGSHLVDTLLGEGRSVRVLLRPSSSLKWLPENDIEVVRISPWNEEVYSSALHGVDTAYLVAGVTHAVSRAAFFDFHSRATTDMLTAASRAETPPRRTIIFSSLAAVGPSHTGTPLIESDEPHPVSWYGESKLEQERIALSFKETLHITILRPPAVYGPRDKDLLHFFTIIKRGVFPAPGGGIGMQSLTHVDDIVRGTLRAAQADIPSGRTYFISTHEIVTWNELARYVAEYFAVSPLRLPFPMWIVPFMGQMAQWISRITGKRYPLDRNKAMEGRHLHWVCSSARAHEELGFTASVPLTHGIVETLNWYRQQAVL